MRVILIQLFVCLLLRHNLIIFILNNVSKCELALTGRLIVIATHQRTSKAKLNECKLKNTVQILTS